MVVSARAPDAGVEGIELPAHPFFVATLFQPQVGALAGQPLHPLIGAFAGGLSRPGPPLTSPTRRGVASIVTGANSGIGLIAARELARSAARRSCWPAATCARARRRC